MKSRWEIMTAWFAVLTVCGWTADLFLHVPLAARWIHVTWRAVGADSARGIGATATLFAVIRTLPVATFLIPLGAGAIVIAIAWFTGPGPDDGEIKRGSTVTDARTLARLTRRRK